MRAFAFLVVVLSFLLAGCGSSSKGPGRLVSPPTPPPGGTLPPDPQPPRVPGIGNNGRLSINVEEGGSVSGSPNLRTCNGPAVCDQDVPRGTVVTLTATPYSGFEFEEWDSCPGPSGTQCVLTIEALSYVKAEFDPR